MVFPPQGGVGKPVLIQSCARFDSPTAGALTDLSQLHTTNCFSLNDAESGNTATSFTALTSPVPGVAMPADFTVAATACASWMQDNRQDLHPVRRRYTEKSLDLICPG
jgi:hypothetical protein